MKSTTRSLDPPRQLDPWERHVLETLLAVPFPGSEELRAQLDSVRVAEEYGEADPSVIFTVARPAVLLASVKRRIPVEAEGRDADGATIQVLLHVVDGYLWELEVYRPDGEPLQCAPDALMLEIFSPDCDAQGRDRTDRVVGTA